MKSSIDPVVGGEELKAMLGGISTSTIYRWISDNTLPPTIDLGGGSGSGGRRRLLWSRDSIIAFLNNQNKGSPQPAPPVKSVAERKKRVAIAVKEMEDIKAIK